MKFSIKQYWWVALVILLLPIALNFILLTPSFTAIVGDEIAWLSFWGGYLGAIISTAAAFIILYIQRKDNESENEKNRADNKAQNELNRIENENSNRANRQLQLNIMKYHQQCHWLDNFRNASLEYINAFNKNDIIMVSHIMWDSPNEALNMIKILLDRVGTTRLKCSLIRKRDNIMDKLAAIITDIDKEYLQKLNDFQLIILFFKSTSIQDRTKPNFLLYLEYIRQGNGDITHIYDIARMEHETVINTSDRVYFNNLFSKIFIGVDKYMGEIQDRLHKYILQEQEDINKLLTDNIES